MEPVSTLAMAAATLVAKAAEHLGEKIWDKFTGDAADKVSEKAVDSGWELLSRIAGRVRGWFRQRADGDGVKAIETVVAAPDSKSSVEKLAEAMKAAFAADPELEKEIRGYVESAEQAEGEVATFTVQAWGNAKIGKVTQINELNARDVTF